MEGNITLSHTYANIIGFDVGILKIKKIKLVIGSFTVLIPIVFKVIKYK